MNDLLHELWTTDNSGLLAETSREETPADAQIRAEWLDSGFIVA